MPIIKIGTSTIAKKKGVISAVVLLMTKTKNEAGMVPSPEFHYKVFANHLRRQSLFRTLV
ncbi:MAG: hypothetical protein JMDDDDMK_05225 [Acidobacteria bacterium]|nr:hypothetical protein [Acidobacteriota bacterium]